MDECEKRLLEAIFGHMNMFVTGLLEAIGDPNVLPVLLKPALKKQFPLLLKYHGVEVKSLEEAIEFINTHASGCRLEVRESPEGLIVEDVILLDECVERAKRFNARTLISECMFILLSYATVYNKEIRFSSYEQDGRIRLRALIK